MGHKRKTCLFNVPKSLDKHYITTEHEYRDRVKALHATKQATLEEKNDQLITTLTRTAYHMEWK